MEMNGFIIIGGLVVAIFIGVFLGALFVKLKNKIDDRKLQKNLVEVVEGKRKNEIEVDGQMIEANRFRLREEDGKEILVDLKGGILEEENVEEVKDEVDKEIERIRSEPYSERIEQDSRSNGKKKRTPGARARIRRFG